MTNFCSLVHTQLNIRRSITTLLRPDHINEHMITIGSLLGNRHLIANYRLVVPLPGGVQVVPLFTMKQRVGEVAGLVGVRDDQLIWVFDGVAGVEAVDVDAGADGGADPLGHLHLDHLPRRVRLVYFFGGADVAHDGLRLVRFLFFVVLRLLQFCFVR